MEILHRESACSKPFSFVDFFRDTPWLNVPGPREAVLVAPLYPRGGLFGGSPEGTPKMSKLQALAAARKKKAQEENAGESAGVEKPLANLKINGDQSSEFTLSTSSHSGASNTSILPSRGFPVRKRKDPNEHEKPKKLPSPKETAQAMQPKTPADSSDADQGEPSAFASTMFGHQRKASRQPQEKKFTLTFAANTSSTATNPFAGPSPDDIVIAAQSKGSTNPVRTKRLD
jgi:elongation factor 1 alpha-like protein